MAKFFVFPSAKPDLSLFGKIHQCSRCRANYTYGEMGTLKCRYHTGDYGQNISRKRRNEIYIKKSVKHYSCCRATCEFYDRKHLQKFPPHGCVPIDHVGDEDEFQSLCNRPFTLIPEIYFKDLTLSKLIRPHESNDYENGENKGLPYKHIRTRNDMLNIISIEVVSPDSTAEKFVSIQVKIDIDKEYDNMLEKFGLKSKDDYGFSSITADEILKSDQKQIKAKFDDISEKFNKNSQLYYNFENIRGIQDGDNESDTDNNDQQTTIESNDLDVKQDSFVPFYIIRRVGNRFDREKLKEYSSLDSCGYL